MIITNPTRKANMNKVEKKDKKSVLPTRKELANAMFNGTPLDLPICYDAIDFLIERGYLKVDLSV